MHELNITSINLHLYSKRTAAPINPTSPAPTRAAVGAAPTTTVLVGAGIEVLAELVLKVVLVTLSLSVLVSVPLLSLVSVAVEISVLVLVTTSVLVSTSLVSLLDSSVVVLVTTSVEEAVTVAMLDGDGATASDSIWNWGV